MFLFMFVLIILIRLVWLVIGVFFGFGLEVVIEVVKLVMVVVIGWDYYGFEFVVNVGCCMVELDLWVLVEYIFFVIVDIIKIVGWVDVLVNVVGYIFEGVVEEIRFVFISLVFVWFFFIFFCYFLFDVDSR